MAYADWVDLRERIKRQFDNLSINTQLPTLDPEALGTIHPDDFPPLRRGFTLYFKDGSQFVSRMYESSLLMGKPNVELVDSFITLMLASLYGEEK